MVEPGTVNLQLIAKLAAYPGVQLVISFSVSLSSSAITCLPTTPKTYNYGSPPLMFGVSYKNQTYTDGVTLTPVFAPIAVKQGVSTPLPSFVKFNAATKMFTVSDITIKDFGDLEVGLRISYVEFPTFEVICTQPLTLFYKPSFKGDKPNA